MPKEIEELEILSKDVMDELAKKYLRECDFKVTPIDYNKAVQLDINQIELKENLNEIITNKNLKKLSIKNETPINILKQLIFIYQLEELEICGYEDYLILKETILLLKEFKNLKKFTLHNSYISKLSLKIYELTSLVQIRLYFNNLEHLDNDIDKLSNLVFLEVACNKFKNLPKSITNLKKLETLIIDDNLMHELDFLRKNMPNLKEVLNMDRNFENMLLINDKQKLMD